MWATLIQLLTALLTSVSFRKLPLQSLYFLLELRNLASVFLVVAGAFATELGDHRVVLGFRLAKTIF